jgi:hypothetical protein
VRRARLAPLLLCVCRVARVAERVPRLAERVDRRPVDLAELAARRAERRAGLPAGGWLASSSLSMVLLKRLKPVFSTDSEL